MLLDLTLEELLLLCVDEGLAELGLELEEAELLAILELTEELPWLASL